MVGTEFMKPLKNNVLLVVISITNNIILLSLTAFLPWRLWQGVTGEIDTWKYFRIVDYFVDNYAFKEFGE